MYSMSIVCDCGASVQALSSVSSVSACGTSKQETAERMTCTVGGRVDTKSILLTG